MIWEDINKTEKKVIEVKETEMKIIEVALDSTTEVDIEEIEVGLGVIEVD